MIERGEEREGKRTRGKWIGREGKRKGEKERERKIWPGRGREREDQETEEHGGGHRGRQKER